jgi:hypothetical protein
MLFNLALLFLFDVANNFSEEGVEGGRDEDATHLA